MQGGSRECAAEGCAKAVSSGIPPIVTSTPLTRRMAKTERSSPCGSHRPSSRSGTGRVRASWDELLRARAEQQLAPQRRVLREGERGALDALLYADKELTVRASQTRLQPAPSPLPEAASSALRANLFRSASWIRSGRRVAVIQGEQWQHRVGMRMDGKPGSQPSCLAASHAAPDTVADYGSMPPGADEMSGSHCCPRRQS